MAPPDTAAGRPLFSIGVTTFDRPEMLRECLASVLKQTTSDLEVILGNDNQNRSLSAASIGIDDSRIRVVNHASRLGECSNLNALLALARGRYFTWLADDDLYDPKYLEGVSASLEMFPEARAVFTSFRVLRGEGTAGTLTGVTELALPRLLSGAQFLSDYWNRSVRALGTAAMYEREYLMSEGGVVALTDDPIAIMSEYLLILRAALLPKVAYVDSPLVVYRAHGASWSTSATTVQVTQAAGLELLRRGASVLLEPRLVGGLRRNLHGLLRTILSVVLRITARQRENKRIATHGAEYVDRVQTLLYELFGSRSAVARRAALFARWYFLRLLPQLVIIANAPAPIRAGGIRARALIRGETYTRELERR